MSLLPPHSAQAPVITSATSFMPHHLGHRPSAHDRTAMHAPLPPSSRPYGGPPMTSGGMPGQGQEHSPWGTPSQYMPGPCLGVGPIGPIGHLSPYGPASGTPWGPVPTSIGSAAGPGVATMGMSGPRPIYGPPDPMACGMYGVSYGELHAGMNDKDKQVEQQHQQQQQQQQQEAQKSAYSPPPGMLSMEPKKKRKRKKSFSGTLPTMVGPDQLQPPMQGTTTTLQPVQVSQDQTQYLQGPYPGVVTSLETYNPVNTAPPPPPEPSTSAPLPTDQNTGNMSQLGTGGPVFPTTMNIPGPGNSANPSQVIHNPNQQQNTTNPNPHPFTAPTMRHINPGTAMQKHANVIRRSDVFQEKKPGVIYAVSISRNDVKKRIKKIKKRAAAAAALAAGKAAAAAPPVDAENKPIDGQAVEPPPTFDALDPDGITQVPPQVAPENQTGELFPPLEEPPEEVEEPKVIFQSALVNIVRKEVKKKKRKKSRPITRRAAVKKDILAPLADALENNQVDEDNPKMVENKIALDQLAQLQKDMAERELKAQAARDVSDDEDSGDEVKKSKSEDKENTEVTAEADKPEEDKPTEAEDVDKKPIIDAPVDGEAEGQDAESKQKRETLEQLGLLSKDQVASTAEGEGGDKEKEKEKETMTEAERKKACGCFACTKLRNGHCVSKYKGIGNYKCEQCGKLFDKRSTLNTHLRVHAGERPYKCNVCAKGYTVDTKLVTHLMRHAGLKPFVCEICGKSFNMKSHLIKHRRVHTGEKPFTCVYCGKSFSENGSLIRHERKHTGEKPYRCEICDKPFAETGSLHRHMKVHEEDRPYRCEVCYKSFKDDGPLVAHMMRHVGMRPYICETCGKSFQMKSHLEKHIRVHTGERPFSCEMCGKCFSENGSLVRHRKRHLGERPFSCEICEKSFTEKVQLVRHAKVHTGERPYGCAVCNKAFRDNCSLVVHMRIHTGQQPYKCEICGKSFNQKGNMAKHMETHMHTDDKPYRCEYCRKGFAESSQLARHMSVHTGDRRFKCEICGRSFNVKQHLARHMRIHTGERPYRCDFCGKSFQHDGSFFKHRRIHTGERPYKCELCDKTFRENADLIKHVTVHTAEKRPMYRVENVVDPTQNRNNEMYTQPKPMDSDERPYKCEMCGKTFKHDLSLVNHWKTHSAERPYKCEVCEKTFRGKGNLGRHMRIHTKGKMPYRVENFDESILAMNKEFMGPKMLPMVDKCYKCEICGMTFRENPELVAHMRIHTTGNLLYDAVPEEEEDDEEEEEPEPVVKTKSKKMSSKPKPFKCSTCGRGFYAKRHLVTHARVHSTDRPFPCDVCGKTFKHEGTIKKHKRIHTGEKPFNCEVCEKSFREKSDLKKHRRTHPEIREAEKAAEIAEKQSLAHNGPVPVVRRNKEERPHKCDECGKAFKQKLSLINHKRVHSGEKPFKCQLCGKFFRERGHLGRHMKTHNKEAEEKAAPAQAAPNPPASMPQTLPQGFLGTQKDRPHPGMPTMGHPQPPFIGQKIMPVGDRIVRCDLCQKSFRDNAEYVNHMRLHTGPKTQYRPGMPDLQGRTDHIIGQKSMPSGDRPYKCEVCEMSFRENGDLVAHMFVHAGVERPYRVENFEESMNWNGEMVGQKHMESLASSHPMSMPPAINTAAIPHWSMAMDNSVSNVLHSANSVVHRGQMENKGHPPQIPIVTDAGHHLEPLWINHQAQQGHSQWAK